MVGNIGEALAALHYGLNLSSASARSQHGVCDGVNIAIKTTQMDRITSSCKPVHLLVLAPKRYGSFLEILIGPGAVVWEMVVSKPISKNGQYQVPFSKLRLLMRDVPNAQQLLWKTSMQ